MAVLINQHGRQKGRAKERVGGAFDLPLGLLSHTHRSDFHFSFHTFLSVTPTPWLRFVCAYLTLTSVTKLGLLPEKGMGAGVTEITVPPLSPSSRHLAVIRSYSKDVIGTLWGRGGSPSCLWDWTIRKADRIRPFSVSNSKFSVWACGVCRDSSDVVFPLSTKHNFVSINTFWWCSPTLYFAKSPLSGRIFGEHYTVS